MSNKFCFPREKDPAYLIAEIGVNHGGNLEMAKKMVLAAKEVGADAVKFQTFTADTLVTDGTLKVAYQESTTSPAESHYDMIKGLEFKRENHAPLLEYCNSLEIDFISTPYDIDSAKFLNDLGVACFKTASADIVDLPLHQFLATTGKPVIIATGMATLGEVERAMTFYENKENIALLHCVSNYPCSIESLNLRVINTLKAAFGTTVGYSDHSVGPLAAALSISLGARVIEKHFTLDKKMEGPDHKASSDPEEFRGLVETVRMAEISLGESTKFCQEEEKQMASVSRKSIVTRSALKAGHLLTQNDLVMKRPGTGLSAVHLQSLIGEPVNRDLPANYLIHWKNMR
jgi:N,N'-diacetyllegionaminate synthase